MSKTHHIVLCKLYIWVKTHYSYRSEGGQVFFLIFFGPRALNELSELCKHTISTPLTLYQSPFSYSAPPRTINIIDSQGQEMENMAGPFTIGSRVLIRCLSTGGESSFIINIIMHQLIGKSSNKTHTRGEEVKIGSLGGGGRGRCDICHFFFEDFPFSFRHRLKI